MTEGIIGDTKTLLKEAKKIPLPILVKAAAGGGGKGMRIVRDLKDLPEILESTSREAKSYFGDGTVFIEKYVEEPRHIEIQVMGDNYGNYVHLFERECSIQRRYQKIIEESPSPTLTPEVRIKMGEAAVLIASEIEYNSAGTVEFLVDKDLNYYFLEMNTRIQVEHPVTEMVTEIDIVSEQIMIAAGNELSFSQEEVYQAGHAMECRIYAEDPSNNFLPSPGEMSLYVEPEGEDIRIDTGIAEATTIHSFYDPMISKLVVWDQNREKARQKMMEALQNYTIHGIKTNISYLLQVLKNKAYIENKISTKYCDEHTVDLIKNANIDKSALDKNLPVLAYVIYSLHEDLLYDDNQDYNIWKAIGYWRERMEISTACDHAEVKVEITKNENGEFTFFVGDIEYDASLLAMEYGILEVYINGVENVFYISKDEKGQGYVSYSGFIFDIKRNDILVQEDFFGTLDVAGKDGGEIVSPMPGKVIKINVKKGKAVKKGDVLMVVEAMKMENNIVAPKDGKVEAVNVITGEMVDGTKELVVMADTN
jgi:3-methylcrotonyl-CoA carboxylase alpha subunit